MLDDLNERLFFCTKTLKQPKVDSVNSQTEKPQMTNSLPDSGGVIFFTVVEIRTDDRCRGDFHGAIRLTSMKGSGLDS